MKFRYSAHHTGFPVASISHCSKLRVPFSEYGVVLCVFSPPKRNTTQNVGNAKYPVESSAALVKVHAPDHYATAQYCGIRF